MNDAVPIRSPSHGLGFTLVEMIVAMALSAVLVTALMSVAASSTKDRQRLRDDQAGREPAWVGGLARQIESDLLMATGVSEVVYVNRVGESRAVPTLYILTNHESGDDVAPHRPVLVWYQLVRVEDRGVLLRQQQPLTRPEGVASQRHSQGGKQVMAVNLREATLGSATLSLEPDAHRQVTTQARTESGFILLVENRPVSFSPVPEQVHLVLTCGAQSEPTDSASNHEDVPTYRRTLLTQ